MVGATFQHAPWKFNTHCVSASSLSSSDLGALELIHVGRVVLSLLAVVYVVLDDEPFWRSASIRLVKCHSPVCHDCLDHKRQMVSAIHRFFIALAVTLYVAEGLSVGINVDPMNPTGWPSSPTLAATGTQWIRLEFKATPNFPTAMAQYKAWTATLHSAGFSVLLIIDYSSQPDNIPWGHTNPSEWTSYIASFGSRCAEIAGNLTNGTVKAYEIWNEPDLTQTHVPAAAYGLLLKAAHAALKGVDPSAVVVMGGLASGNPGYVTSSAAATGGFLHADQVGLHPYGQRPFPNWPNPTWGFGYIGDLINNYLATAPMANQRLPIMITEVGTSDTSVQGPFPWMVFDSVATSYTRLQVSAVIWFCWSDGMVSPFGLVTSSGTEKADYHSFVNFTRS